MAVYSLSLYLGSSEGGKTLEQRNYLSNRHSWSPQYQQTLFIHSNIPCHHVLTYSVSPFSTYKHSHNLNSSIRSDVGLTLEASALKLFTGISYIINSVDKSKLSAYKECYLPLPCPCQAQALSCLLRGFQLFKKIKHLIKCTLVSVVQSCLDLSILRSHYLFFQGLPR